MNLSTVDNAIDLFYAICHKNHKKCYFFTDTGKLKSVPLSTFDFCAEFVICKNWHLHIPKTKLVVSENEGLHSGRDPNTNTRYANECKDKVHSKQSDMNRQEFTT